MYHNYQTNNNFIENQHNNCNEKKYMKKMTKVENIEIYKWMEDRIKLFPSKKI